MSIVAREIQKTVPAQAVACDACGKESEPSEMYQDLHTEGWITTSASGSYGCVDHHDFCSPACAIVHLSAPESETAAT